MAGSETLIDALVCSCCRSHLAHSHAAWPRGIVLIDLLWTDGPIADIVV
jgi:hypothetical protein